MELNHVNLPVADVSATRDFFEKGSDLEQTMTGAKALEAQIADGTAKTEGDDLEPARLDHGRVRPPLQRSCQVRKATPFLAKDDSYEADDLGTPIAE